MTTVDAGATSGTGQVPEVVCRVCERPVTSARSRAERLGEKCRRKCRRRFQQLPLMSVAAAAGRRDPRGDQHRQALLELDQITSALIEDTERLEQQMHDVQANRPQPDQPHKYEPTPGDQTTNWAGQPAAPCRWCPLPRGNSIHRRARAPRKAPVSARQQLLAAAGRDRDRAVLGEREDQEDGHR
jgi:hypothetical protein